MATITDYLDWRGDLPFSVSPFNEVDNYICSKLGTPDFDGIVPAGNKLVGYRMAMAALDERLGGASRLGVLSSPHVLPVMRKLTATARFDALRLGGYTAVLDVDKAVQFSAVTLGLPDGSWYVAFRGTDDTLAGWKEDFLMSVMDQVPAQKYALDYLVWAAGTFAGPLRVGGHSKGGNLAVYAAIHAPAFVKDRIMAVYNNDGPGFRTSVVGTPEYESIRGRLYSFLPQRSMVGMLLQRTDRISIVECRASGMTAHDGFNWQVLGTRFVRCEEFSRSSRAFGEAMEEVEKGMNEAERREFVDALFDTLGSTGAVTLTDLSEGRITQALTLFRETRRAPAVQKFAAQVLEAMFREYAEEVREALPEARLPWRKKSEEKSPPAQE